MNIGTKLRTILIVATCLNTALMATDVTGFASPVLDLIYRWASIILNFVIVALATYFNNDYTEIAKEYTAQMRLEKKKEDLPEDYWEKSEDGEHDE